MDIYSMIEAAKRVETLNKSRPCPRPYNNPHEATLGFYLRSTVVIDPGPGECEYRSTYVTGEKHCSKKSFDELRPITLREMMVPKVHQGRYLLCRVSTPPRTIVGTTMLIEDTNCDVEELVLYNFQKSITDDPCEIFHVNNTIMIIKEPYLKYSSSGLFICIRVDSPSDVIFVDETDEILRSVGVMRQITQSFEVLKQTANEYFELKDYKSAIKYYNRAFKVEQSPVIYLNLAALYLQLERFYEAYINAKKALDSGGINKEKALYRIGKAAYGMRRWQEAANHFTALLKLHPRLKEATEQLERSNARLNEENTGVYDLHKMYDDAYVKKVRYFDIADYTGPVDVVEISKDNKGLIVTKNIQKGTLLLVSKALSASFNDELTKKIVLQSFNMITKKIDLQSETLNLMKTIQTLKDNPNEADDVYSLYTGDSNRSEKIPFGVIDTARIEKICSFNSFRIENINSNPYRDDDEQERDETGSGLWILPSFINHSCIPNAHRTFYGDVLMIYAIKDIKKGEEVLISYIEPFLQYEERTKQLKMYDISKCKCKLCELDRNDRFLEARRNLRNVYYDKARLAVFMEPHRAANIVSHYVNKTQNLYRHRQEYQIDMILPLQIEAQHQVFKHEYKKAINRFKRINEIYGEYIYTLTPFPHLRLAKCCKEFNKMEQSKVYINKAIEENIVRMGGEKMLFKTIFKDILQEFELFDLI